MNFDRSELNKSF
ncbi:Putative uncharacterized protein [Lactococcus lactis subsp. lactis A12]|uniref:Uncharacterized protein n=1 Tax=Lactococcus lactis subsp. lactis A12 TaxID=1137134 RepID=S6FRL6_LACLL|nr:Putative uncharacterized protein [Lactococcus lactis subsp. lactis A12]SBW29641.1 Hypothetical protein LLA12_00466 [Lactococcus lactis subsp. lactis]